jgi:pentatricopeptide repeat protein
MEASNTTPRPYLVGLMTAVLKGDFIFYSSHNSFHTIPLVSSILNIVVLVSKMMDEYEYLSDRRIALGITPLCSEFNRGLFQGFNLLGVETEVANNQDDKQRLDRSTSLEALTLEYERMISTQPPLAKHVKTPEAKQQGLLTPLYLLKAFNAEIDMVIQRGLKHQDHTCLAAAMDHVTKLKSLGLVPTLGTYLPILYGCYQRSSLERLVEIYKQMLADGVFPDNVVYNIMIKSYTKLGMPEKAMAMYNEMIERGIEPNVRILSSLIGTLALMGNTADAVNTYDQIIALGYRPDITLFQVMIDAFSKSFDLGNALAWYNKMLSFGLKPDTIIYTSLMLGVSKSIDPDATRRWVSVIATKYIFSYTLSFC